MFPHLPHPALATGPCGPPYGSRSEWTDGQALGPVGGWEGEKGPRLVKQVVNRWMFKGQKMQAMDE